MSGVPAVTGPSWCRSPSGAFRRCVGNVGSRFSGASRFEDTENHALTMPKNSAECLRRRRANNAWSFRNEAPFLDLHFPSRGRSGGGGAGTRRPGVPG
jgi:hypothetical protein